MTNAQDLKEQLKEETLKYRRKISNSGLGNLGLNVSSPPVHLCLADSPLLYLQNGVVARMDNVTWERSHCIVPGTW